MRQYETAFLIAPNLPEEDNEKLISQMAEVVSKQKGKMINVDEWGKRKLAYPIQKFEEAFYVFFLYEGDPSIPLELERRFKQTEPIIRYMTIKSEISEGAKRRRRVSTKKKRDVVRGKEEKGHEKKEALNEEARKDLEKAPQEEPAEKPKKTEKAEPKEPLKEEAKSEQDLEQKAEEKEESKAEPKEDEKETQGAEAESKPGEALKEEPKEDKRAELEAEAKDKAKEKPREKRPPEEKEKKEK
jgi:small subunit ribosomal protein S6